MQIGELIRRAARMYGDAPALVEDGRSLSFREFDAATDRLGNALLAKGLVAGDRVAILLPNGIECLIVYYALAKSGLVRVPLHVREALSNHQYKLADSGARVLIHAGETELEAELLEHCKSSLARYKYPRWFNFVEDLPKTATGKIQRFKLRSN